jgi:hypothetical protein
VLQLNYIIFEYKEWKFTFFYGKRKWKGRKKIFYCFFSLFKSSSWKIVNTWVEFINKKIFQIYFKDLQRCEIPSLWKVLLMSFSPIMVWYMSHKKSPKKMMEFFCEISINCLRIILISLCIGFIIYSQHENVTIVGWFPSWQHKMFLLRSQSNSLFE